MSIRQDDVQRQVLVASLVGVPHLRVQTCRTAVQGVGAIVDGQAVLLSVQLELTLADAVAVATNQGGKVRLGRIHDCVDVVVTLDDVCHLAVLVRNHDGHDGATVVGD